MLTDPAARKDPAQLRAAMESANRAAQRAVLTSVRVNSIVMGSLGGLMLLGGAGVGVASLTGVLPSGAGIAAPILLGIGGLFVFLSRYTALPPRALLRHGVQRQATVREVRSVGRTLGIERPGISATLCQVTVVLDLPELGAQGSGILHKQFIFGSDISRLQVGGLVAVRCDAKNPRRLAFDWEDT